MNGYLTDIGRLGKGRGANRKPGSAIAYTHDIFTHAAEEGLDVYLLTGSVQETLRDRLYTEIAKHSFADDIRDVLVKGRNVSIFIWDDLTQSPPSPECETLMTEAAQHPEWGVLDIRSSGTREEGDTINHFILAKSRDGEPERWILRVEMPHSYHTDIEVKSGKFEVPAAILFDTPEAKAEGKPLLDAFRKISNAVEGSERTIQQLRLAATPGVQETLDTQSAHTVEPACVCKEG